MKTRFEENKIYNPSYNMEDAQSDFTFESSEFIRKLLKELNPDFGDSDFTDIVISNALNNIWKNTTNSNALFI